MVYHPIFSEDSHFDSYFSTKLKSPTLHHLPLSCLWLYNFQVQGWPAGKLLGRAWWFIRCALNKTEESWHFGEVFYEARSNKESSRTVYSWLICSSDTGHWSLTLIKSGVSIPEILKDSSGFMGDVLVVRWRTCISTSNVCVEYNYWADVSECNMTLSIYMSLTILTCTRSLSPCQCTMQALVPTSVWFSCQSCDFLEYICQDNVGRNVFLGHVISIVQLPHKLWTWCLQQKEDHWINKKSIAIAILIQIYPTKSVVIGAAAFFLLQMAFSCFFQNITDRFFSSKIYRSVVPFPNSVKMMVPNSGNLTLLVWKFLDPRLSPFLGKSMTSSWWMNSLPVPCHRRIAPAAFEVWPLETWEQMRRYVDQPKRHPLLGLDEIFLGIWSHPHLTKKMGWDFRDDISRDFWEKTLPPHGSGKLDVSFED